MEKTIDDIKKEFDGFIDERIKSTDKKKEDVLAPYLSQIKRALKNGIAKKDIYDFLAKNGFQIKFSTFKNKLIAKGLAKKRSVKREE